MKKIAFTVIVVLAATSVATQATADWRTDHQLREDSWNEYYHPKQEIEYPPAECGYFCKAVGLSIIAVIAAGAYKRHQEQQGRSRYIGTVPAR